MDFSGRRTKHLRPKFAAAAMLLAHWFAASIGGAAQITFGSPTNYPVGNTPRAVATGDFNHDGKLDLAVANTANHSVSILLSNGDDTFQTANNFTAGKNPFAIAAPDFNGDGRADLVLIDSSGVSVAWPIVLSALAILRAPEEGPPAVPQTAPTGVQPQQAEAPKSANGQARGTVEPTRQANAGQP